MRTAEGKIVLFDVATGTQQAFWPIDARALIAAGTHTTEAPSGVEPVAPEMPPEHVGVPVPAVPTLPPSGEPRPRRRATPATE